MLREQPKMTPETKASRWAASAVVVLIAVGLVFFRALVVMIAFNWAVSPWTETRISWLAALGMVLLTSDLKHIFRDKGDE